jgi:hypothetical protein
MKRRTAIASKNFKQSNIASKFNLKFGESVHRAGAHFIETTGTFGSSFSARRSTCSLSWGWWSSRTPSSTDDFSATERRSGTFTDKTQLPGTTGPIQCAHCFLLSHRKSKLKSSNESLCNTYIMAEVENDNGQAVKNLQIPSGFKGS